VVENEVRWSLKIADTLRRRVSFEIVLHKSLCCLYCFITIRRVSDLEQRTYELGEGAEERSERANSYISDDVSNAVLGTCIREGVVRASNFLASLLLMYCSIS